VGHTDVVEQVLWTGDKRTETLAVLFEGEGVGVAMC
jgi:hypothetical protein